MAWRGTYKDVPRASGRLFRAASILPQTRSSCTPLQESHQCASLPKMSVGPHLFPAQGPSVTLSLLETTQDTKPKVPSLHLKPVVIWPTAAQVPH